MGRMQRTKGAAAERDAAAMLRILPGFEECCRRASGSERDGAGGRCGVDLENTAPFVFQVKAHARPQPLAALAEAVAAARDGEIPCAITRQSSRSSSTDWAFTFTRRDALLLLEVFMRFRQSFPGRVEEIRQP